jgi:hypothetical protein
MTWAPLRAGAASRRSGRPRSDQPIVERMHEPQQELTGPNGVGLCANVSGAAATPQIRKRENADTLFALSRIPILFV